MSKNKKKKKSKKNHQHDHDHHQQKVHSQQTSSPPPQEDVNTPFPNKNDPINKSKKRKRSQPTIEENDPSNNTTTVVPIAPYAIQWLEKRKMKIPDALQNCNANAAASLSSLDSIDGMLNLLPSLRERERRALIRHVEKCINNAKQGGDHDGNSGSKAEELEGSDGEYDINDTNQQNNSDIQRGIWPENVEFSNNYRWDPTVPHEIKDQYHPPTKMRQRTPRFSNKVYFKKIADPNHPAYGEFGLYCALPSGAPPGSWLLDYVGHVTLGENQDRSSDYVSDFGTKSELACDANTYGNEARFLNDFRNTGRYPNVEFNFRRDANGELRQGVYVKQKKDAREEGFEGVRHHEELLVSYGKSYWRSRVGNLTDFVWRLPGQGMPVGGKPGVVKENKGGSP